MVFSRTQFFLLLLVLIIFPFYASKLIWLSRSQKTAGRVWFMGHTLELNGSISQHHVILFIVGNDSITFNAISNVGFKVGDNVPVRYITSDPTDAKINTPFFIWADTCLYSLLPALFLLIVFLTPARLDPLIPWRAKIKIGRAPFIKVVPCSRN